MVRLFVNKSKATIKLTLHYERGHPSEIPPDYYYVHLALLQSYKEIRNNVKTSGSVGYFVASASLFFFLPISED
jgi:hypothetical protein